MAFLILPRCGIRAVVMGNMDFPIFLADLLAGFLFTGFSIRRPFEGENDLPCLLGCLASMIARVQSRITSIP